MFDLGCKNENSTAVGSTQLRTILDGNSACRAGAEIIRCFKCGFCPGRIIDRAGDPQITEHAVAHVQRGCHQRAGIDPGGRAENDAVLIDEVDLTIGRQLTEDPARVTLINSVQGNRITGGLLKPDCIVAADIKALPIEDGPLRALRNG